MEGESSDPVSGEVQESDLLRALLAAAREERDAATARFHEIVDRRAFRILSQLGSYRQRLPVSKRKRRQSVSASTEPVVVPSTPIPPGILVDASPLTESNRSGIARVLVQTARELQGITGVVKLVLPTPEGLVVADRFQNEVLGDVPVPLSRTWTSAAPVLLSATVHPARDLAAWNAGVAQLHREGGTYVQIIHDLIPITEPDFFPYWMRQYFPVWLLDVVRSADVILADSQLTKQAVLSWIDENRPARRSGQRVGVLRLASLFDSAAGEWPRVRNPEQPTVLVVGTVEPRKGIECVLDTAEALWASGVEVRFVVVGAQGWIGESVKARLADLHHSDQPFLWIQTADDAELQRIYRTSDLLLAPSRAEGFGLPLVEAAACGLPVLARDLPVFREILSDDRSFFSFDAELPRRLVERLNDASPSQPVNPGWSWRDAARSVLAAITGEETPPTTAGPLPGQREPIGVGDTFEQ